MPVAFKNLMTHGSAIRNAYRTSLRSSSFWEPRYPSLGIWFRFGLVKLLLVRFRLQTNACNFKAWLSLLDIVLMILPQVHLRKPCYDFSVL